MPKPFKQGLLFGAGFGLAFFVVVILCFYFVFPLIFDSPTTRITTKPEIGTIVDKAPPVKEFDQFLGSTGVHASEFKNTGVLASGPGAIVGKALSNNKPVAGVRLRLALNKSVMSQWATTNAQGEYSVSVPYGQYQIDGYELDKFSADNALSNKITHPQVMHFSSVFNVSEETNGRGLRFRFIDPVVKNSSQQRYSVDDDIVVTWEAYPNAVRYQVQIVEKDDPHSWSNKRLFEWDERPSVSQPRISIKESAVKVNPGKFYEVQIDAFDSSNTLISKTPNKISGYDFEVVD